MIDTPDHKIEIERLEKDVTALSDALAKLGSKDDFHKLILILKRPGWTTPAELAFANTIVHGMTAQVRTLETMKTDLVNASEKVTAASRSIAQH